MDAMTTELQIRTERCDGYETPIDSMSAVASSGQSRYRSLTAQALTIGFLQLRNLLVQTSDHSGDLGN